MCVPSLQRTGLMKTNIPSYSVPSLQRTNRYQKTDLDFARDNLQTQENVLSQPMPSIPKPTQCSLPSSGPLSVCPERKPEYPKKPHHHELEKMPGTVAPQNSNPHRHPNLNFSSLLDKQTHQLCLKPISSQACLTHLWRQHRPSEGQTGYCWRRQSALGQQGCRTHPPPMTRRLQTALAPRHRSHTSLH